MALDLVGRQGSSAGARRGRARRTADVAPWPQAGSPRPAAAGGRLGARSDRTGCDTDPAAFTLLVRVRVQSFLLRSVGAHGVCAAAVDQSDVTEDADVDVVHGEILEGARLSDVVEELGTVAGDTRKLRDEVVGEELAEALDIVELVGVEEVLVELLEDGQIFGGLHSVGHGFFNPVLCGPAFMAGGLSLLCRLRGAGVPSCAADQCRSVAPSSTSAQLSAGPAGDGIALSERGHGT